MSNTSKNDIRIILIIIYFNKTKTSTEGERTLPVKGLQSIREGDRDSR